MPTNRIHGFYILVLTFFLCTSPVAFSQSKLMDGYIITTAGDTVRGLVRHEGWTESPERVKFTASASQSEEGFSADEIIGFYISGLNELYKAKKIGILNISLDQIYSTAPSLVAKDSIQVFLQEVVSGDVARLYEFVNKAEETHFFVEKNGELNQLYNYPFYKEVDGKKYLLVYDEYKRQLTDLTRDAAKFKSPVPGYLEKPLKRYIENYNQSFSGVLHASSSTDNGLTFDLDINGGLENWHEPPLNVSRKFTYGFGIRMSLPRKFNNRFFKVGLFMTPKVLIPYSPSYADEITMKTLELGAGSYIGFGKIRPYFGFHYSGVINNYRQTFLGVQGGLSYNRIVNLEIGHFANFYSVFTETGFFRAPRISIHYMVNLNKLLGRFSK